ncbi:MAG: PKD domain-containing protein [Bacteroidota bacterium]|nr:PKD domain-containing protein [Bacteroidota bacterium]
MSLQMKFFVFLIVFSVSGGSVFAQPSASFTANPESGCVGEVVYFTNTSDLLSCSGPNYEWDFDNGLTSDLENPQITFTTAGDYVVSLTVTCDEGFDTYTFTVEILPTPDASFTVGAYMGCAPYSAQFTNNSTQGGGTIDEWYWTFGDGISSAEENPNHLYNTPGSYSVTLKATNANGCFDVFEIQDIIQVSDTPSVSIMALPQAHCQTPIDVFFDATVNVSSGLGYTAAWDFGDGGSSSNTDETHTYTSQGNFDVQLIITDDYGCERVLDSLDYIHIHPVNPEYQIFNSSSDLVTNGIVCIDQTTYFSCQNEGYNVRWDFGGGMVSNSPVASIIFTTAGTHEITMTVDPNGDCEVSETFTVEVEAPSPSYTINPADGFACDIPFVVDFTSSTSADIAEYEWLFGDGNNSNEENPSYSYESFGTFQPVLQVTSVNGCLGIYSGADVTIQQPSANFSIDTTEGCIGLEVTAAYDSLTHPDAISSFSWDFGEDGVPAYDGNTVESYVYDNVGEFVIELAVTDTSGCTNIFTQDVQVGDHQTPSFTFDPLGTYICPLDSISFESTSVEMDSIDEFEWLFGDTLEWQWGTETGDILDDFQFDQDTGWVQVVHVVNHNGCRDSLFMNSLFYISGPIINSINSTYDCDLGNEYEFYVNLIEATEWDWIIENESGGLVDQFLNTTDSTLLYTFPADGEYEIFVVASNVDSGCEYEDSITINVIQPTALFGLTPSSQCAGLPYSFDGSGSLNAEQYYWEFGDGEVTEWSEDPTAQHTYNYIGDVDVTLHVMDANGCEDEMTLTLHIVGPEISLDNLPEIGCTPFTLNLTGEVSAEDPVILIEFIIGDWDTTLDVSALGQNTVPFDFTSVFTQEGIFDLIITARTNNCPVGNTVVWEDFLNLTSLEASFISNIQGTCVGTEIQFTPGEENGNYDYDWDFGDGNYSTETTPGYTYDNHGVYSVSLTISDSESGCVSTENRVDYIEVQEAIADFTVTPTSVSCPPLQPDITNNSPGLYGTTYEWNSGYNENSTEFEPDFTYNHAGEYTLTVLAETSFGCTAEASELLTVSGPAGELVVSDNQVCLHESIDFEIINGEGIDAIAWTFGDGAGASGETASHAYANMPSSGNSYPVVATLTGGSCDVQYEVDILIYDVHAEFSLIDPETSAFMDTFACSPMEISLNNISTGDDLSYLWTIYETSETFTTENLESMVFVNNSQSDSIINVTLEIENSTVGCVDDTTVQLVVGNVPQPNITPDTIVCQDDIFNLHAEGGGTYLWYPGMYLSETEIANPLVQPEESMIYYLTVTGDNGCVNTDSMHVGIQLPLTTMLDQLTDTINIGENTSVLVTTDQENALLSWTPDVASISCLDCESPIFNPEESMDYQLVVSDSLQCFSEEFIVSITVVENYTLDVPKAFTPEGNPVNRLVFVRGIGIRQLREFSIYNRWGEKLFTTDDINQGWDGYYNGKLQPVDTYVYFVEAEMYDGTVRTKKGNILLMQ